MTIALELYKLVNATSIFVTLLRTLGDYYFILCPQFCYNIILLVGFVKNGFMTYLPHIIDSYIYRFFMFNVTDECKYLNMKIKNYLNFRSHCECDRKFQQCLNKVNSSTAHTLGVIFFNIVKVMCFKEECLYR